MIPPPPYFLGNEIVLWRGNVHRSLFLHFFMIFVVRYFFIILPLDRNWPLVNFTSRGLWWSPIRRAFDKRKCQIEFFSCTFLLFVDEKKSNFYRKYVPQNTMNVLGHYVGGMWKMIECSRTLVWWPLVLCHMGWILFGIYAKNI